MKSRNEILTLLAQVKPLFAKRYGVRRLGLFGSCARGEQTEVSDIDILVDIEPIIGLDFVSLADELESLLGQRVELVSTRAVTRESLNAIEPDLVYV